MWPISQSKRLQICFTTFSYSVPLTLPSHDLYHNCRVSNLLPTEHRTMQQKGCTLYGTISRQIALHICTYLHVSSQNNALQSTVFTSPQFLLTSIKLSTEVSGGTLPTWQNFQLEFPASWCSGDSPGLPRDLKVVPPDVLCYLVYCLQNLNRILPPSLQNVPDQSLYQIITVHTPRNVHAGENVRLQNAGHKPTASYLSLKVSLKKPQTSWEREGGFRCLSNETVYEGSP